MSVVSSDSCTLPTVRTYQPAFAFDPDMTIRKSLIKISAYWNPERSEGTLYRRCFIVFSMTYPDNVLPAFILTGKNMPPLFIPIDYQYFTKL